MKIKFHFPAAIFQFLRDDGRGLLLSVFGCLWCVTLWLGRFFVVGTSQYFYFVYNLALAVIPLILSTIIIRIKNPVAIGFLAMAWFFFLPNAPYLVTDLIHLRPRTDAPFWFDWLMMVSFAGVGFFIGCASLNQIHRRVERWKGKVLAWAFVAVVLSAASFGIYLGRFPRWNSWDIITQPWAFFSDVLERVIEGNPQMAGYCGGVTFLLVAGYLALHPGMQSRPDIRVGRI